MLTHKKQQTNDTGEKASEHHAQQTDQMIDKAHHHQAALFSPSGKELEEAEPDADEGEEDVDHRDSAGSFEDEREEVVDELGEDGGNDGGADKDPSKAGKGGEGDGEVDPSAEEGESSRGWCHIFTWLLSTSQGVRVSDCVVEDRAFISCLQTSSSYQAPNWKNVLYCCTCLGGGPHRF